MFIMVWTTITEKTWIIKFIQTKVRITQKIKYDILIKNQIFIIYLYGYWQVNINDL